jgi:penicillin-binding protein-related factor A (putative recombinase)
MKTKPQTEKEITAAIRSFLKARGIFHYKQWQGLGSQKGVSDIIGIYKGLYMAIEIKTKKAIKCPGRCNHKTCRSQKAFLSEVRLAGGIAMVARSVNDVIRWMEGEAP